MGSSQKVDVRGDGRVVIYLRDGLKRPIWQARIRVPNSTGYKVVSTKTENQRDAERFALDLYEEIYMHVRAGGSIKSKTYRQVFDEWVDAIICCWIIYTLLFLVDYVLDLALLTVPTID